MLTARFAFSSFVAIAVVGAVASSAACSSGDTVGSSGNSAGATGTSTSGATGIFGSGSGTGATGNGGTGSTGGGGTGAGGNASGSAGSGTGAAGGAGSGTSGSSSDGGGDISFSMTIVPIFQANCGTGGIECHGDPGVTSQVQKRPYLGPQPPATVPTATAMMIWSGLMVASAEDPSMPLVSPGSDSNSFLMHKVDNTLNSLDCSKGDDDGNCGLAMPYTATMLPQSTRDTIRAWINGGAQFN